jgi:hypothetical protein
MHLIGMLVFVVMRVNMFVGVNVFMLVFVLHVSTPEAVKNWTIAE